MKDATRQLAQLQAMQSHLAAQQATLSQTQSVLEEQQSLVEELLVEAREQTGSLKRFETDLAVTIGQTITNSFSPQMEHMTTKLVEAVSKLHDVERGWYGGQYEASGKPNKAITANTNAVVLESLAYIERGPFVRYQ